MINIDFLPNWQTLRGGFQRGRTRWYIIPIENQRKEAVMAIARRQFGAFDKNNEEHVQFILGEIEKLRQCHDNLRRYDQRTELLTGFALGWWALSYTSLFGAILMSAAFGLLSANFFGRPEYARKEQEQLNSLYEIYCWCIRSYGKQVTSNNNFLALAKAFTCWESMKNLKKPFGDWSGVSNEFREILLQHPQREEFLNDKPEAQGWWNYITSFAPGTRQENKLDEAPKVNMFTSVKEKYLFTLYHRKTEESTSLTGTLMQKGREQVVAAAKKFI